MGKKLSRKTKRLVIRPLRKSDYRVWKKTGEEMLDLRNRWDRRPSPRELTPLEFRKLLSVQASQRKHDRFYDLAVFCGSELVGKVAVMDVMRSLSQQGFLGYRIYNRYWAKGYGYEASRALIDIAFRDLKLHRVEAGVEPGNIRSIRLARKLGLKKEGLKRKAVFLRGKWRDLLAYAACCEDYRLKWQGRADTRN